MWISLVADGVIALLLCVTIFYCYLVNKRLNALRSGKDELKGVIDGLTSATTAAQSSIEQLKHAGRDVIGSLDNSVTDGRTLADELSLMIEAGNNLADRLEGGRQNAAKVGVTNVQVASGKTMRPSTAVKTPQPTAAAKAQPRATAGVKTEAAKAGEGLESELLKALRRAR